MSQDSTSKSWFCVFNNPQEYGYEGMEPKEILEALRDIWIQDSLTKTCGLVYCISPQGLHHVHAVFEDVKTMRFSAIKKLFPAMHIEPTKGTKREAEDYLNKVGKFEEKDEVILEGIWHGEIRGVQGKRSDIDTVGELIEQGCTPNEIFNISFRYRKFSNMIKDAYYAKRLAEAPIKKEMTVVWHVGESGAGKSYSRVELIKKYGKDNVYLMSDYKGGGFDNYCGEKVLFMDEFRGQMPFNELLIILDKYVNQVHARYANAYTLYDEVHITSIMPPEKLYEVMVENWRVFEPQEQLFRRVTSIVYHAKVVNKFFSYEKQMEDYSSFDALMIEAHSNWKNVLKNLDIINSDDLPF